MIRVTTSTGECFEATTDRDIVRMMIDSERLAARKTLATFMASTARRCSIWNGSNIEATNALDFLESLAVEGFIMIDRNTTL